MTELILIALWLCIIIPSPSPVTGLIGGIVVYWAVTQRVHWAAKGRRWKW